MSLTIVVMVIILSVCFLFLRRRGPGAAPWWWQGTLTGPLQTDGHPASAADTAAPGLREPGRASGDGRGRPHGRSRGRSDSGWSAPSEHEEHRRSEGQDAPEQPTGRACCTISGSWRAWWRSRRPPYQGRDG